MKTLKFTISLLIFISFLTVTGQIKNEALTDHSKSNNKEISIYDIQYTEDPYGNSPHAGETVTVVGIVTASAKDYDLGYVYIQDEGGGPWSGIFIYGSGLSGFYRGEEITVTGEVAEDFGLTYLSVSSAELTGEYKEVVASDIDPSDSTSYIANGWEKWESVLVRYKDPNGAKLYFSHPQVQNYGDYGVSVLGKKKIKKLGLILAGRQTSSYYSSSGVQIVADSAWYDNSGMMNVPPIETETWMEMDAVVGIMFYSYGDYHLTPRNNDDFININVELETTDLPVSPLAAITEINSNDFAIYPNPSSDEVNIISEAEPINLYELFDIQGLQLVQKQINSKHLKLDVSAFQPGIYVVVIHTKKDKKQSARIYVTR